MKTAYLIGFWSYNDGFPLINANLRTVFQLTAVKKQNTTVHDDNCFPKLRLHVTIFCKPVYA